MHATFAETRAVHLADLFREAAERHGNRPAFATRQGRDPHRAVSFAELHSQALDLATGLVDLGVEPGNAVGLLSDNRFEWILCDCALLSIGAVDVPRGSDITDAEIRHILAHSEAVAVFVESRALQERVVRQKDACPRLRWIVAMDVTVASPPGHPHLQELAARGRQLREAGDRRVEERSAKLQSDAVATLIYTSGTTGVPKGVALTHANLLSQIRNLPVRLGPEDRLLSILPIWHAYERMVEYVCIAQGACTYYTSVRAVGEDLKSVRPTFMASAPRLWESLHQRILNGVRTAPAAKRFLFRSALFCAGGCRGSLAYLQGRALDLKGRSVPESLTLGLGHLLRWLLLLLPCLILDWLVLRKVRAALGGCLRCTISGGGALPESIDRFLNDAGIPVLEGYGLTETSPVLAVRREDKVVIGTVGAPYPGTELRIVDPASRKVLYPDPSRPDGGRGLRGEIEARGPQVMLGYHRQPEATAAVLSDGWFRTGDLGLFTFNDCLRIVGRIKETIVLTSGENVEPGPIEGRLVQSPLILQAMVVGQDAKALTALLVPNLEGLRAAGLAASNLAELAGNPRVPGMLEAEVRRLVNRESGFKPQELIHDCVVLPKAFEVGDELTATYKLRRHVITAKYAPGPRD